MDASEPTDPCRHFVALVCGLKGRVVRFAAKNRCCQCHEHGLAEGLSDRFFSD
jgi:hypothetical protein